MYFIVVKPFLKRWNWNFQNVAQKNQFSRKIY